MIKQILNNTVKPIAKFTIWLYEQTRNIKRGDSYEEERSLFRDIVAAMVLIGVLIFGAIATAVKFFGVPLPF